MADFHHTIISYEDAQKILPVFKWYATEGHWRDLRDDARRIAKELEDVRPIRYDLGGKQIILSEKQIKFLEDVRAEIGK